jgi:phenylacetate-coenzyme A ligase PaaK-like adenylate-forming protein
MNANPFDFGWSAFNATLASCMDAVQLAKLQRDRLGHLLQHAERASPFYKALYSNIDISTAALCNIPVVDKEELMLHFDAWVCDPHIQIKTLQHFLHKSNLTNLYLGRYVVWESSGSSGKPGIFLQNARALSIYDALEFTRKPPAEIWQHALNPLWLGERIAFVGAIGEHFASNVSFERIKTMMQMPSNLFKSFSILNPVDDLVASLNAFQPTYLMTYPTAAVTLADQMNAIIEAQGSHHFDYQQPQLGVLSFDVLAPEAGVVIEIDNLQIAGIARLAGAPKVQNAGVDLFCKLGDRVFVGKILYRVYAQIQTDLSFAKKLCTKSSGYKIGRPEDMRHAFVEF